MFDCVRSDKKLSNRKFFFAIVLASFVNNVIFAEPAQNFQDNAAAVGNVQIQPANLPDWDSTNSGLNPGYTVKQMQNPRPQNVPPGDLLPNVTATSAIVMEASTGHVIYSRNPNKKMFPASTTKMMTLILGLEYGKPNEIVTVGENAFGVEGSTLFLEKGDKIPLGELLCGMMMHSGNDAAVAIAEHIDGNTKKFAEHMTRRAGELGALGTQFKNPHGLPDENHFTTAYDLALLASYGYSLEGFEETVGTQEKTFQWVHDPAKLLRNENQLLWIYRGGNGVKTGYTDVAGRCLVSAAKRNGIQLVAVVLDSYFMWNDSIALLDYGFKNVETETVIRGGDIIKVLPVVSGHKKTIAVKTADKVVVPVFKNDKNFSVEYELPKVLNAPIKKGESVGIARVILDGKEIASTDLITADNDSQKSFFRLMLDNIKKLFGFHSDR